MIITLRPHLRHLSYQNGCMYAELLRVNNNTKFQSIFFSFLIWFIFRSIKVRFGSYFFCNLIFCFRSNFWYNVSISKQADHIFIFFSTSKLNKPKSMFTSHCQLIYYFFFVLFLFFICFGQGCQKRFGTKFLENVYRRIS